MILKNYCQTQGSTVKPFFRKVKIYDFLYSILVNFKGADLCISTFSISEEFIRKVQLLKENGSVNNVVVIVDESVLFKNKNILFYAVEVCDKIYLTTNHSKVIIINQDKVIISSANMNSNFRYEAGVEITDHTTVLYFLNEFENICKNALEFNEL